MVEEKISSEILEKSLRWSSTKEGAIREMLWIVWDTTPGRSLANERVRPRMKFLKKQKGEQVRPGDFTCALTQTINSLLRSVGWVALSTVKSFGTSGSGISLSHPSTSSQASRSADNLSICLTKARAQKVVNVGNGPATFRVDAGFLYPLCESCAVGSSSSVGAPNVRWRLVDRVREEDMTVRDRASCAAVGRGDEPSSFRDF